MAPDEGNDLPLLDPAVLDRLRTELEDDDGVWNVFVQNFIEHLPHRTEKLRLTLTTGDLVGAMDAVLSLKTSSQMVGAERLAGLAMELERALRHETLDSEPARVLPRLAADRLRQIIRCARQTSYLLQKYLHSG
ncbi:Hpt domain-containing protein [Pseudarthrobacter sp. HLT3-5]|uniref:Hpt domain-containing protein n=1 Tax=Pseudarthrobacter cellobiosi TaxID=2953654 RepID=UPI00208F6360|nr:Hpt domain-containing protein [Pseudarthrobacter sp. HLT3-5]MCO4276498.1 Hpt domain-containing protein [Pseudarthrobacter sp. HLT3-5]